jgi:hypothetical protein
MRIHVPGTAIASEGIVRIATGGGHEVSPDE